MFHFVLAIIAGMAVGLHKKHGIRAIVAIALFAVLIDLDHWLPAYADLGVKAFHNVFVVVLIPLLLFYAAYHYEHKLKKPSIQWQSYFLILLVVLVSHIVADYFYDYPGAGVSLFFPLTTAVYSVPLSLKTYFPGSDQWVLISLQSIALLAGALVIMLARFTEDFIYFFEEKHESLRKALNSAKQKV